MRRATVESFDGTIIAYQVFGGGPAVVFGNGIGLDWSGLELQIEHLARTFTVILWDYRGTYRSQRPPADSDLGPAVHARDLAAVLDAEGIDTPFDYIGWSMGVQVGLELVRRRPHPIRSMVAISGLTGELARNAFGYEPLAPLIRTGTEVGIKQHRIVHAVLRRIMVSPVLIPVLKRLRLLNRTCNDEVFMAMARGVGATDKEIYLRLMRGLIEHDASDLLGMIDFPVLILAGDRDLLVPPAIARRMHARLPTSELVELPGCTHFAIVEQPKRVNAVISRFLASGL